MEKDFIREHFEHAINTVRENKDEYKYPEYIEYFIDKTVTSFEEECSTEDDIVDVIAKSTLLAFFLLSEE